MMCRSCSSGNVEIFLDLSPQPHCNRLVRPGEPDPPHYPLRLGFCHDCTLVQIDHTIPKEEMFRDYPYVSGTTATLAQHFADSTKRLAEQYDIVPDDLVVDIGSNDGTWLRQWNCQTLGVEADETIAVSALKSGVNTWSGFFDEGCAKAIRHCTKPAKIVTAAGVFFHLEELHSVVRGCELLLADDGVLIVQAIYLGDMIANTAFDQIYHEHLCYYTLRSISALLEPHGLQVFHVERFPIHGGTVEYHICRTGTREIDHTAFYLWEEERITQLHEIETYRKFGERAGVLMHDLRGVLELYGSAGRQVWAYGAPAKAATLLNSAHIGPNLLQFAVEKNPLKIGLEIPGCRIPIIDERATRTEDDLPSRHTPDAYLVLAWNFLDEFIAKERDWLKAGGEFIVPIPEVRVIRGSDV